MISLTKFKIVALIVFLVGASLALTISLATADSSHPAYLLKPTHFQPPANFHNGAITAYNQARKSIIKPMASER